MELSGKVIAFLIARDGDPGEPNTFGIKPKQTRGDNVSTTLLPRYSFFCSSHSIMCSLLLAIALCCTYEQTAASLSTCACVIVSSKNESCIMPNVASNATNAITITNSISVKPDLLSIIYNFDFNSVIVLTISLVLSKDLIC